ncbi:DUF3267 domain-containing protein [bacterium]|nr:DUF3267 domain-containing protein [bacterium]
MDPNTSYTKLDRTISILQANLYGTFLMLPILVILGLPYILIWGLAPLWWELLSFLTHVGVLVLGFVIGILLHEWLHGITWKVIGKLPPGAIKYGVMWKFLTPYAHLTMPVPIKIYRLGGGMPGLALGILPGILGIILGSGWLLWVGVLFSWAAVGDFIMLWLLRDVPADCWVEDHPEQVGCTILVPDPTPNR